MFFPHVNRIKIMMVCISIQLSLSLPWPLPAFAVREANTKTGALKERIEFDVKWTFIPLITTYMETFKVKDGRGSVFFLLTHQAASNTFWNDRMESVVDPSTLLPEQMETIIKDKNGKRKETIIFQRSLGKAMYIKQARRDGTETIESIEITSRSMDPLSAFYYMRKRLSPENPFLELQGITGSRRFLMSGRVVGEEGIKVSAGRFKTFRFECTLKFWKNGSKEDKNEGLEKSRANSFTLWVTKDKNRFPVKIRYGLALGSLNVVAKSLVSYERKVREVPS
ncbi:MAG: DUF3108 domain-containing protein, partial [Deltaproteobacteria bacterium]|nr:DUF3108 domain-containing protein [Deltaproteobacteria bacterium]